MYKKSAFCKQCRYETFEVAYIEGIEPWSHAMRLPRGIPRGTRTSRSFFFSKINLANFVSLCIPRVFLSAHTLFFLLKLVLLCVHPKWTPLLFLAAFLLLLRQYDIRKAKQSWRSWEINCDETQDQIATLMYFGAVILVSGNTTFRLPQFAFWVNERALSFLTRVQDSKLEQ